MIVLVMIIMIMIMIIIIIINIIININPCTTNHHGDTKRGPASQTPQRRLHS
jgi:hypothetical protein